MITITKSITISAAHWLPYVPKGHPCGRLHGHNYEITLILQGERKHLGRTGWLLDYGDLDPVFDWIREHFDHQSLNDQGMSNPTAECLATYLFLNVPNGPWDDHLVGVRVAETPATTAEYRQARLRTGELAGGQP